MLDTRHLDFIFEGRIQISGFIYVGFYFVLFFFIVHGSIT